MARLDGKVALISGAARGQGAAEARMFSREGASVVLGDVLDDDGGKVEAKIRELGGRATYVRLDVTVEAQWQRAVDTAVRAYGKLDILVNNAGILLTGPIEEISEEDWDRIMAVNAKGVFLGTKHAIPAMRRAGGGSIVNISSTAGLTGSLFASAAYTATKGAIRLFTKATAVQHAGDGIRVQLGPSGAHRYPHDRDLPGRPRQAGVSGGEQEYPVGTGRHPRGGRLRSPLPGL